MAATVVDSPEPAPEPAPVLIRLTADQALAVQAALQAYLAMHTTGLLPDARAALHAVSHPCHQVRVG